MAHDSGLPHDLDSIFILTITGGVLILLDGVFNFYMSKGISSTVYMMVFPFLSSYDIHTLLSIGGIVSGAILVAGTFLVIFWKVARSMFQRFKVFTSISGAILAVISFPAGGGFIIGFVLVFISSVWLFTISLSKIKRNKKRRKAHTTAPKPNVFLTSEERFIWNILKKNNGTLLQARLILLSGLSKVKVTRILDKLETKGLIERRRVGMSNVVILK